MSWSLNLQSNFNENILVMRVFIYKTYTNIQLLFLPNICITCTLTLTIMSSCVLGRTEVDRPRRTWDEGVGRDKGETREDTRDCAAGRAAIR